MGLRSPPGFPRWSAAIFAGWFAASFRAVVRHKDAVDRLARTDELTGLDNRRAFLASALREANRGEREENLALLVLDIDHFKRINDTHGHGVGDLVLAGVARILSRCVGEAGDGRPDGRGGIRGLAAGLRPRRR